MSAIAGRVLLLPKGNYSNNTTYVLLDMVYYENATYVCKKTSFGHLPTDTEFWQVMVDVPSTANITPEGLGIGYGESVTSESDTSKLATLTDYNLRVNGIVAVKFANNVPASSTLNINNKGAKPIYNRGSALADNVILAGDTVLFVYDGTNYNLLNIDRAFGDIGDLDNVAISNPQHEDALIFDSLAGKWRNGSQSKTLTSLTDVVMNNLQDGQIIEYDSDSGKWVNANVVKDTQTVTGNPLSFTTDSAQVAQNTVITLEPIQSGSGDASPNNERPFIGYDEINITVSSKNLWYGDNVSGIGTKEFPLALPIGTYTLSAIVTSSDTNHTLSGVIFTFDDGTTDKILLSRSTSRTNATLSIAKNVKSIMFLASNNVANSAGDSFSFANIQIESGSSATDYESPYTDITLELDSTIYGGTLDVENGKLTVTHARVDMGNLNWVYVSQNAQFYAPQSDKKIGTSYQICEIYKSEVGADKAIWGGASNDRFYVKDTSYTDATTFKTAVTGHYIVYELAEPIVYHLTPHQVRLLEGANVVTTNGTSISLTYRNGEIAKLEDLSEIGESVNVLSDTKMSYAANGKVGAKNLNSYPYYETTMTQNGITFTDLGDGTVKVGGSSAQTASANTSFRCHRHDNSKNALYLNKGKYAISGCPKGGSASSYFLNVAPNGTPDNYDYGTGNTFNVESDNTQMYVNIHIRSGTTIPAGGIVFKPMIRIAEDTDDTFQPYAMTNKKLTDYVTANKADDFIDITNYASESNKYTFPKDGYLCMYSGTSSSGAMMAYIYGSNDVYISSIYLNVQRTYDKNATFVKKGMKTYLVSNVTGGQLRFFGLSE